MKRLRASLFAGLIAFFLLECLIGYLYIQQTQKEQSLEKQRASLLLSQGSAGVLFGLDSILNVIESIHKEMKQRKLAEGEFHQLAALTYAPFKDVLRAVNFINEQFIIEYVYPEASNAKAKNKNLKEHSDPSVLKLFNGEGPSKVDRTFLEPVPLFQGGIGMIYYLPVYGGWLNIVINVDSFFEGFQVNRVMSQGAHIALKDAESGKYYYKHQNFQESDATVVISKSFMNEELLFVQDLSEALREIRNDNISRMIFRSIFAVLFSLVVGWCVLLLFKTKERYEKINDESILIKILVHDLSNLLTSIGGSLLVIKSSYKKPEKVERMVETAIPAFDSASEILNTTKELFWDRVKFKPTTIDWKKMINELEQTHHSIIEKRKLVVECIGKEELNLVGEEMIFKNQVLGNLFLNSIKYSDEGQTIQVESFSNGLILRNICTGVEEEKFKSLNGSKQFESRKDEKEGGLGFGFTIAKLIALNMGLRVELKYNKSNSEVQTIIKKL